MAPSPISRDGVAMHDNRSVSIPAGLAAPFSWHCTLLHKDAPATCLGSKRPFSPPVIQDTYVGTFVPTPYFLPGLATRLTTDVSHALFACRLAGALQSLPFLFASVWLLWRPGETSSLAGLVMAFTPMAFFSAAVSPSGLEIGAAICFIAGAIKLSRDNLSRSAVIALGVSGAALGSTRVLGPLWACLATGFLALVAGRTGVAVALRRFPVTGFSMFALALTATLANVVWSAFNLPVSGAGRSLSLIFPALAYLPKVGLEAIGIFGWANTPMPPFAYLLWVGAGAGLLAAALLSGAVRELRKLELSAAVAVVAVLLISGFLIVPFGPSPQGRYMLPVLSVIPLLAGEALSRSRALPRAAWFLRFAPALGLAAGAVHFIALYSAGHRFAVGSSGTWFFPFAPRWQPPLGWWPWLGFALAGACCYALSLAPALDATVTKDGVK